MRHSVLAMMGVALQIAGSGCGDNDAGQESQPSPVATSTPIASPTFTPTVGPDLTITVQATSDPISAVIHVVARVQNNGSAPVSFQVGCTGSGIIDDSGIDLALADGAGRLLSQEVEYPCGPPLLCPAAILELAVGQSVTREFDFDGTVWVLDEPENPRSGCDYDVPSHNPYPRCTPMQLHSGHYTVIARFSYCSRESAHRDGVVESGTTVQWP